MPDPRPDDDFARQADRPEPGLLVEFLHFLRHNKKWWLTPILLILLLSGLLILLGGLPGAPLIYTFF